MESDLRLIGGHPAVDLLNTLDPDAPDGDHLRSAADVAAWLRHVGVGGSARLSDARAVRGRIDAVLRPLARGARPDPDALDALRVLEVDALAGAMLTLHGYEWKDPLSRIVDSATDLLLHGPVERLRQCDNCPWLFIDLSRNRSRRWCSMESCGTEIKTRRLTERRRRTRTAR